MKTIAVALGAALAGLAIGAWWGFREVSQLRAQLASRSTVPAATPGSAPTAVTPGKPQSPEPDTRQKTDRAKASTSAADEKARQELVAQVQDRNEKLVAAGSTIRELQDKLDKLDADATNAKNESERLVAANRNLQEQLESASRNLESLKSDLKAREAKTSQTDSVTQDLKKQVDDASRRLARMGQISGEFEELERRRDVYMLNVLRRYREVTDLFRTLALRLDNPREASVPTSNDVSRIQQAITAADEDMRQMQVLSRRAAQLQKDLLALRR